MKVSQRLERFFPGSLLLALVVWSAGCRSQQEGDGAGVSLPTRTGESLIEFYQIALASRWGFHCDFEPSCSEFGREAVGRHGLVVGSWMIADRLMRDHSFSRESYSHTSDGRPLDPVQDNAFWQTSFVGAEPSSSEDDRHGVGGIDAEQGSSGAVIGDADRLFRFAETLYAEGDFERARIEYQRYLFLFPEGESAERCRARVALCLSELGRNDEALLSVGSLPSGDSRRLLRSLLLARGGEPLRALDLADETSSRAEVESTRQEALLLGGFYALEAADASAARDRFAHLPEEAADRLLAECDRFDQLPHRSPLAAGLLSAVLPGAGQAYSGRFADAAMAFLFNSILIGGTAVAAVEEEEVTAVVLGQVAFGFYCGNVFGGVNAAERFNRRERDRFLTRARGLVRGERARWALTPASGGGTLSIYFDF